MASMRRSVMTLYSGPNDILSHQVRMVLAEKGVSVNVVTVCEFETCEELAELNPYNSLPTLVDRELVIYKPQVILEYLDERFPHPPLLPVYPVTRAKARMMIDRIEEDWYSQVDLILNGSEQEIKQAREQLKALITNVLPVFASSPFFLSEEFTLLDCAVAPLLWRLPHLGINLPGSVKVIQQYEERVFNRNAFQNSLTEMEKEMRQNNEY